MYTYFSRFLHIISSYSGLTRWSRSNQVANLPHLDTPVKPECDTMGTDAATCRGRSMVEILGVLAIIGVLSVGAIAGYSKAMMKYKLNKHAEAVNMLINNVLQLKGQLQHDTDTSTFYGTLLYKMYLLPDGIQYVSNYQLEDMWFKGNIIISYNNTKISDTYSNDFGQIKFIFNPSAQGTEICRNIIVAAKENASNIYTVSLYKVAESSPASSTGQLDGDASCSSKTECLHNASLTKINNMCNACDNGNCHLFITWK
jgi:type II secretory pathway pseudopilin PulG